MNFEGEILIILRFLSVKIAVKLIKLRFCFLQAVDRQALHFLNGLWPSRTWWRKKGGFGWTTVGLGLHNG
ncbi:hypothetical protein D3877_12205 [Azospirillum cavernae]|uniref:Uncharacterized protein n=1 Tax=Azospirillum cavernae TaxID=2320860 RepID=A0A418VV02_9PROT|nr:hypothetical protein D3877_12205 [Azospirillum cavernae]